MEKATITVSTLGDTKNYTVVLRDSSNGKVVAFIEAVDEKHARELCASIDRAVEVSGNF